MAQPGIWDLSFIVVFTKTSNQSHLRVFHHNKIINEVECTSSITQVRVPLEYQDDIQFEFTSADSNSFYFFCIGVTRKHGTNLCLKNFLLLPKSADQPEPDMMNSIHYNGSWFGSHMTQQFFRKKKILSHNRSILKFTSNLQRLPDHDHTDRQRSGLGYWYWHNAIDNRQYIPISAHWIAKFKPGTACFYRNDLVWDFPRLNIFSDMHFDVKKDVFELTKFNNTTITVPSDRFLGSKKIVNELEYLHFVANALFLLPGIIKNAHRFSK